MRRSCLVSLFVLSSSFAAADDAAWMQVGDVGNFTKNKHIRMVQEHVWISLSNHRMRVHALFQFKNEGPATKVTMAFPDGIMDYKERKPSAPQAIRWMKSSVDGKPVKITRQVYKKVNGFDYDSYTHVWLKSVPFGKGQTRMVTVDYEAAHGDIGDYIQDTYTLKTGATWKGSIGKAVIYIDWSALNGQMDPEIEKVPQPGYSGNKVKLTMTSPRSAKIEFKNIEPNFDIGMSWAPTFWNFFVNGKKVTGLPVDEGRSTFIAGKGSDPQIYVENLAYLLLGWKKADEITSRAQGETIKFDYKKKSFVVAKGRLSIDGKLIKLRRGYEKDEFGVWIYVRDLVQVLKGSYRYDSKWDRAYIKL